MPSEAEPLPCIIDTDPGVDDALALLLALASPELLIVAITLTHGNTTLPSALLNLQKLFHALRIHLDEFPEERSKWPGLDQKLREKHGVGRIIVFLGSEGPISGDAATAAYFHGQDGLSDLTTRHPDLHPPDLLTPHAFYTISTASSTQGLSTLLLDYPPHTVGYLALGPLTSLAHLHALSPSPAESLLHHFGPILVMGGALDVPGNTSPVAEFNTFADPVAASTIFALGLHSLYLFPLDITTPHTLPFDIYALLVDEHFVDTSAPSRAHMKTALVHFTSSFLERTREVVRRFGGVEMEMHDPLVVWAAIEWSRSGEKVVEEDQERKGEFAPRWSWERKEFEVETIGKLTRGMLVVDRRRSAGVALQAQARSSNRAVAVEEQLAGVAAEEVSAMRGTRVVVGTPGSKALRELLLGRIWGVHETAL